MLTHQIFENAKLLIAGNHDKMIQSILDYEFLCNKETTSLVGVIHPFSSQGSAKYFWGSQIILLPVYKTIEEASQHNPDSKILVNALSHRSAAELTKTAINLGFSFIYIMAEGIAERESLEIAHQSKLQNCLVLGPSSIGFLYPGSMRFGLIGGPITNVKNQGLFCPGQINLVTRSGGLFNELASTLNQVKLGLHSGSAIGGDRYPGSGFLEHVLLWDKSPGVKAHLILGEVGGQYEYEVAEALKNRLITKPVIVHCIGSSAEVLPKHLQFGHAGAKANSNLETAKNKSQALKEAGAIVADSYGDIQTKLIQFKSDQNLPDYTVFEVGEIPLTKSQAIKEGKIRVNPSFVCTISDDRGQEATYGSKPISYFCDPENNQSISDVLIQLWFKKTYPSWASTYIDMVIKILADHGPSTSGAHNGRVTARAGKDVVDSLASSLLTIGPRYGGAGDAASSSFLNAYNDGISAEEFVESHKNQRKYISGIGHRIKSIHNPDKRVELLDKFTAANFPFPRKVFEYAKEVEAITSSKKDNLILNVDGAYGSLLCDMWLQLGYSNQEILEMIQTGVVNALFAFSRSIGMIGHILDEKRQKSNLYRHDPEDILFLID